MADKKVSSEVVEFISSRDAATFYRFSHDHISRLCRQGKIQGILQDGVWLVDKKSLTGFFSKRGVYPKDVNASNALPKSPRSVLVYALPQTEIQGFKEHESAHNPEQILDVAPLVRKAAKQKINRIFLQRYL